MRPVNSGCTVTRYRRPPDPQCVCTFTFCMCVSARTLLFWHAVLPSDKFGLLSHVASKSPASNSCKPQQWHQDWFADLPWQRRPDVESSSKQKHREQHRGLDMVGIHPKNKCFLFEIFLKVQSYLSNWWQIHSGHLPRVETAVLQQYEALKIMKI